MFEDRANLKVVVLCLHLPITLSYRELGIFIFLRILVVVVVTLKIISGTNTFIHSCDYIENHTPLNGQNLYPLSVRGSLYKANV